MKKSVLASSLIALLTSIGTANALTWTGTEDLSTINAQITDAGDTMDFVLSPIDSLNPISEQLIIDGSSLGVMNSFTFDSGDDLNPYVLTDTIAVSQGVLHFSNVEINNITIDADISNSTTTAMGVYIGTANSTDPTSTVHGALTLDGSINVASHGVYLGYASLGLLESSADITTVSGHGIYAYNTDINGDLNVSGEINTTGSGYGVYGYNANIDGAVNISGDISTTGYGLYFINASTGDFSNTGAITATGSGYGAYFSNWNVDGDVNLSGSITSASYAVSVNNGEASGSFYSDATISSTNGYGLYLYSFNLGGGFDVTGDISAKYNGINLSYLSTEYVTSTANVTSTSGTAFYMHDVSLTGDVNVSGDISASSMGLDFYGVNAKNLIVDTNIDASANGIYLRSNFLKNVDVSGAIDAGSNGLYLYDMNIDSLSTTADITGSVGVYVYDSKINDGIDISGTMVTSGVGLNISSSFANYLNSNAVINAGTSSAYQLTGLKIENGINISNEVTGNITIGDVETGTGFVLDSGLVWNGNLQMNGELTSDVGTAFSWIADTNQTINMTGTGIFKGEVYGIDLGGGNDTLNVTSGTLGVYAINGVETINLTNSTFWMGADLSEGKPIMAVNANGTTEVSFTTSNVELGFNPGAFAEGETLTLLAADTITIDDLTSMIMKYEGVEWTYGTLSFVDNAVGDELVWTFERDYIWGTAGSELLLNNAQVDCEGSDCVLVSQDGTGITGRINVYGSGVQGLINLFTFAETELISGATTSSSTALLELENIEMNDVVIAGTITNTGTSGDAVQLIDATVYNDIVVTGDLSSVGHGVYGTNLNINNFTYNPTNIGIVTTGNSGSGIYLETGVIAGNVNVIGNITAGDNGLHIGSCEDYADPVTVGGDITVTGGTIIAGNNGVRFGGTEYTESVFNGDIMVNSIIEASNHALRIGGDSYSKTTVNGGITFTSESVVAGEAALRLGGNTYSTTTVNGNIYMSIDSSETDSPAARIGGDEYSVVTISGDTEIYGNYTSGSSGIRIGGEGSVLMEGKLTIDAAITSDTVGIKVGVDQRNADLESVIIKDVVSISGAITSSEIGIAFSNDEGMIHLFENVYIDATVTAEEHGVKFGGGQESIFIAEKDISVGGTITALNNSGVMFGGQGDFSFDDVIVSADITAEKEGVKFGGEEGTEAFDVKSITFNGTTDAAHNGLQIFGVNVNGTIKNTGSLIARTEDFTGGSYSETHGIDIIESDINEIINTASGIIQGQYGVSLSAEHYTGDTLLRADNGLVNDKDLTIVNNGQIIGTVYAAIALDTTSEHGDANYFDNVLNYSGFGTLSGAIVDIDMNGGNDTLNIHDANMTMPTLASVENVNITDTVLKLDLTDDNKSGVLIDTTSTESLTLSSILFDVSVSATTFDGSELVLMEVDNISGDLRSLGITFDDVAYSSTGTFEVRDNGAGMDQLIFIFNDDSESISAVQPSTGGIEHVGAISVASMNNSLAVTKSVASMLQGRTMGVRQAKLMTDTEFAFASEIQTDIKAIFSFFKNLDGGIWFQTFGQADSYAGTVLGNGMTSTGYDSTSMGVTFGYDHNVSDKVLLGLATSYVSGDVSGANGSFDTASTSLQFNVYGSYTAEDYYVDGILGYGLGIYDQQRHIGSDTASADFNSSQLSAQINVGRVFFVQNDLALTPYAKSAYMTVTQDAYEESGSVHALSMDQVEFNSFQVGGGLEVSYIIAGKSESWMPRAHFEYAAELDEGAIAVDPTIMSTGGNGTALVTPDMGTHIYRFGFGVTYVVEDGHYISLDTQFEERDNYSSQSIFLKGKWMF